jgi:hypothetical protein
VVELFQEITGIPKHLDTKVLHHKLCGQKTLAFDKNVAQLLDFILQHQNPLSVTTVNVSLYNILTHEMVSTNLQAWLLQGLEISEKIYLEHQNERFVQSTVKLSGTISKVMLPRFDTQACGFKTWLKYEGEPRDR